MTSACQILVESLAFADALFEPIRDPMVEYWAAVWVLRWRYAERGLPYRGGGSKDSERALTELVKAGLVVRRRAVQKTIGIRLTPSGLAEAWRLIGVGPDDALVVTREVHRLGSGRRWVPEVRFNQGRGWGDGHQADLKSVCRFHLPALTAGWIESQCDSFGRVGFRTTRGGLDAMVEAETSFSSDVNAGHSRPPEAAPDVVELYVGSYAESIAWLNAQTDVSVDSRGEIGNLPLPTSAWIEGAGAYCGP